MAKYCPFKDGPSLSQDCIECDDKICRKNIFCCVIAGTRTYNNWEEFMQKMDAVLRNKDPKSVMIVTGGARGADAMAERYAKMRGTYLRVMPADWSKDPATGRVNKAAGYLRNRAMHEYASRFPDRGCVIFWDGKSKGTSHSIGLAREFGTQLRVIHVKV